MERDIDFLSVVLHYDAWVFGYVEASCDFAYFIAFRIVYGPAFDGEKSGFILPVLILNVNLFAFQFVCIFEVFDIGQPQVGLSVSFR